MKPTIAELENFIRYYKPKGWVGAIREFDFAPLITEEELEIILKGKIPEDKRFDRWYVKDAIKAWLEKKNLTST